MARGSVLPARGGRKQYVHGDAFFDLVETSAIKLGLRSIVMGEIICRNPSLLSRLGDLRSSSKRLSKIVDKILEGGDLHISIVNDGHSSFYQRKITLAARQGMSSSQVESTLIIELCNTYYEALGRKPHMYQFVDAQAYGEAMEVLEWKSVKKHVKILNELQTSNCSLGPSKYEVGFTERGWDDFRKYLEYQRGSGHTARIEKHWKRRSSSG